MAEQQPATGPSLIGTVLKDSYRLERLIGEGGMGVVYEAAHTRLPRRFAVKLLRGTETVDDATRERFRREAFIASALGHRHICEVIDLDAMADGTLYMVLEYLEGESLAARLHRQRGLPAQAALATARQVASALDVAHAHGIVHRDLKPENVFMCREADGAEVVKLLDFGISKITASPSKLTRTTSLLGTPHCMSPEQALGESDRVDPRTDVFAFGVMVFEMLAGRPPFVGDTVHAVLYQVVHEPAPSIRTFVPALPAALDEVLGRALAKERDARYATAGDFVAALAPLLEAASAAVPAAAPPPSVRHGGPAVSETPPAEGAPLATARTALSQTPAEAFASLIDKSGPLAARPPVSTPGPAVAPAPGPAAGPPSRRRLLLWVFGIAAGLGLVAGAIVALASWQHGRADPRASLETASRPDVVEIRVEVTPRGAEVTWDGRRMAGTSWRVPGDRRAHRLEIRAPRHRPLMREVLADRDQALVIALAPDPDAGGVTAPLPAPSAPAAPRPAKRGARPTTGAPRIIESPDGL